MKMIGLSRESDGRLRKMKKSETRHLLCVQQQCLIISTGGVIPRTVLGEHDVLTSNFLKLKKASILLAFFFFGI
jgi:hypothetical protein